jgi:UDPglucose 6-dehydrogenase
MSGLFPARVFPNSAIGVVCIDKDATQDRAPEAAARFPIYEPGPGRSGGQERRRGPGCSFTTDACRPCRATPTRCSLPSARPSRRGDGHADLSYVYAAAREIAENMGAGYTVIVTKSTVPVGTGREIEQILREDPRPMAISTSVPNPEFLREGSAIGDFMRPDRVVIGAAERARARPPCARFIARST